MTSLPVLAIVGGPMAGKSTAMRAVQEAFGSKVVVVKEMATFLFEGGYPAPGVQVPFSDEWLIQFQKLIIPNQIGFEEGAKQTAKQSGARLLVTDRGLLDGGVYLPGGLSAAEELLGMYGLSLKAAFERYDQVIHLESLATADSVKFGRTGNQARYETLEQAVALELRTREVWGLHPKWTFIPGNLGIEYTVSRVLSIVSSYVDVEIERKFLLADVPQIDLGIGIPIVQGYIVTGDSELRLRQIGGVNYLGVKNMEPRSRLSWQQQIPQQVFDLLWKQVIGQVHKTRYKISHEGLTLELDIYEGTLAGLVTLECEFPNEEASHRFILPEWAEGAREVTDNPAYKNAALAIHGRPE